MVSERGLGDIIQFSRFVLEASKVTKRVTFEVPVSLVDLLLQLFFGTNVKLVTSAIKQNSNDFICALCSLPLASMNYSESIFLLRARLTLEQIRIVG